VNQQVESYLALRRHQLKEHDASIRNNINMVEYSLQKGQGFADGSGNFMRKARMSILLMDQMQLGLAEDRLEH
jgi:hypothetical protein